MSSVEKKGYPAPWKNYLFLAKQIAFPLLQLNVRSEVIRLVSNLRLSLFVASMLGFIWIPMLNQRPPAWRNALIFLDSSDQAGGQCKKCFLIVNYYGFILLWANINCWKWPNIEPKCWTKCSTYCSNNEQNVQMFKYVQMFKMCSKYVQKICSKNMFKICSICSNVQNMFKMFKCSNIEQNVVIKSLRLGQKM